MKTRQRLRTVFGPLTVLAALAYGWPAPTVAAQGSGIDSGSIPKIGFVDLTIPTMAAGYSWENVEWIYVSNQGTIKANASTLGVTWSRNRMTKLFTFPVKSLAPGEGVWIQVELGAYNQVAPGTQMVYRADYYNAVFESSESNNDIYMNH